MSIKDTYKHMREILNNIVSDIEKSENGNKAASQRVRTGTVRLEKIAKLFRKESIAFEKKNKGQKKPARSAVNAKKSTSAGKASTAKTKSSSSSKSKGSFVKARPKAKSVQATTSVRSHQLSLKRATAKLPTRRVSV